MGELSGLIRFIRSISVRCARKEEVVLYES